MRVQVLRDGVPVALEVRPEESAGEDGPIGRIGAAVQESAQDADAYYALERYGPVEAFGKAVQRTYDASALTVRMLWKMLLLEVSLDNLSGPLSIAQYAGHSARGGLTPFLEFLALVSVSLAVLNLLPIPILDGGHLLYYLIELFKGSPVSEEAQLVGQKIGLALLIGLMGLAFFNDLARLMG
jgi:regulator of sigma E protease